MGENEQSGLDGSKLRKRSPIHVDRRHVMSDEQFQSKQEDYQI